MLNRTWKIVLLVVALVTLIWDDLLGTSTWWISIIAVAILLISEVLYSPHMHSAEMSAREKHTRRHKRRR